MYGVNTEGIYYLLSQFGFSHPLPILLPFGGEDIKQDIVNSKLNHIAEDALELSVLPCQVLGLQVCTVTGAYLPKMSKCVLQGASTS